MSTRRSRRPPARWEAARPELPRLKARIPRARAGAAWARQRRPPTAELYRCYREVFFAHNAKGVADVLGGLGSARRTAAPTARGDARTAARPATRLPELSIVVPVWSRTPELAEMAARTLERVWEVARLPTEVIVIDNGSPVERPLPARVHRFPENRRCRDRLEHRHPNGPRSRGRRAEQRLPGRAGVGRGALRGGHHGPAHRLPVHRPLRRRRLPPARPGRHGGLVLHAHARAV